VYTESASECGGLGLPQKIRVTFVCDDTAKPEISTWTMVFDSDLPQRGCFSVVTLMTMGILNMRVFQAEKGDRY
jgi:hypothetical protein